MGFFGEIMGSKMPESCEAEQTLCQAQWFL